MASVMHALPTATISRRSALLSVLGFALAGSCGAAFGQGGRLQTIHLFRGLEGASFGMDDLAARLARSGVQAVVHNHGEAGMVAEAVASGVRAGARHGAVVLAGHSLGAGAAIQVAEQLRDVPVRLIVTFDPVAPLAVPGNVARLVNYYQSNNGWGQAIGRGPGFHGALTNIDLRDRPDIDHFTIDRNPRLVSEAAALIRGASGGRRSGRD